MLSCGFDIIYKEKIMPLVSKGNASLEGGVLSVPRKIVAAVARMLHNAVSWSWSTRSNDTPPPPPVRKSVIKYTTRTKGGGGFDEIERNPLAWRNS